MTSDVVQHVHSGHTVCVLGFLISYIIYIGVYRVGLVAALHPPLVSHPPFNFAPGCTNGPKDWVQKNGLNISSSKRHSPFIYVYPLKSANKSSLPPGSGCKKGWVRKKIFEVGPKKEECEKGGGCEKVGAVRFRTRVRKKFSGRFAPAPTFEKSCIRPWLQLVKVSQVR